MSRPTQDTADRKRDYLYETFTLCGVTFQSLPILCLQYRCSPTTPIWAPSISLAATLEIDVSFFSSSY